jgi:hypothetical protein
MSESEAPRFKRRNISAAIAADVKGFVVIDDEDGRLFEASDCDWREQHRVTTCSPGAQTV